MDPLETPDPVSTTESMQGLPEQIDLQQQDPNANGLIPLYDINQHIIPLAISSNAQSAVFGQQQNIEQQHQQSLPHYFSVHENPQQQYFPQQSVQIPHPHPQQSVQIPHPHPQQSVQIPHPQQFSMPFSTMQQPSSQSVGMGMAQMVHPMQQQAHPNYTTIQGQQQQQQIASHHQQSQQTHQQVYEVYADADADDVPDRPQENLESRKRKNQENPAAEKAKCIVCQSTTNARIEERAICQYRKCCFNCYKAFRDLVLGFSEDLLLHKECKNKPLSMDQIPIAIGKPRAVKKCCKWAFYMHLGLDKTQLTSAKVKENDNGNNEVEQTAEMEGTSADFSTNITSSTVTHKEELALLMERVKILTEEIETKNIAANTSHVNPLKDKFSLEWKPSYPYAKYCICVERYGRDGAHFLSHFMIINGLLSVKPTNGNSHLYCCPAGRPIRAMELRDYIKEFLPEHEEEPEMGNCFIYASVGKIDNECNIVDEGDRIIYFGRKKTCEAGSGHSQDRVQFKSKFNYIRYYY